MTSMRVNNSGHSGQSVLTTKFQQARKIFSLTLLTAAVALWGGNAHAAAGTWTQTTSGGLWSNTANWSGGTVANASGSTAFFNAVDITADNTVHLDSARTITGLTFGDTATGTPASWILDNNGNAANTLTGIGTITVNALGTGKSATISAVIAGSTPIIKAGAGTLVLSGANTLNKLDSNNASFAWRLDAGTVVIASDSAFGVSTGTGYLASTLVNLNAATLQASGSARTVANPIWLSQNSTVSGSESITFSGTFGGRGGNRTLINNITGGGTLSLTNDVHTSFALGAALTLTFDGTGNTLISGAIKNNPGGAVVAGNIVKAGAGRLTLSGTNTYTGTTAVNAGTLLVNSPGSLHASSAVTVANGATLGGSGTINGTVTVTAGGTILLGASSSTLALASSTAPTYNVSGSTYTTLKILASASTLDKVSASATTGNSVANVNLVIDTTGLSGNVSSTTIYSAGGAITGPFHSVTVIGNTAYTATPDYSTSGLIKLELTGSGPTTYTVTFDNNTGSGSMTAQTGSSATALTSNTFTKTGYTFAGWNTLANNTGTAYADGASYPFTASTTLYAQWTINSYTVTFDNNTGSGTMTAQTGSSAAALTANTFTKTGYTFAGWNTAANGSGTAYADGASYPFTASTTLYAQWTANSYMVTFDGNGGGTPSPTSKSVTYASTYGTLATVTRTGYTFNGWFTAASGGTQVTSGTTVAITGAQTLYAQWTAASATITLADMLVAVNTTYGTPSASPTSFHVSGSDLTGNLTVTPPSGYEVSLSSGSGYTTSLSITASGTLASTQVYVRLAATAGVSGSPYSGTITVSGGGASSQTIATASSTVAKATPTVVVTPYTVTYDGNPHTATVASITGVNSETGATVGTVTLNTTHTTAGVYASDSWSFAGTANYNDIGTSTSTVTVANPSFETPGTLLGGPWASFGSPWSITGSPSAWQQIKAVDGAVFTNAPDGVWVGLINGDDCPITAPLVQNLNTSVTAGDTLSVTFYIGRQLGAAGGAGVAYFDVAGTKYTMAFDTSAMSAGDWQLTTLTKTITNSGNLILGFYGTTGHAINAWLDNITNVSRTSGSGSQTLTNTINKADSSVTAPTVGTYTYTGSPQGPNSGATATGSTGAVTYSYEGTSGTSYGPNATRPTNVGSYTVIATVAADSNFNTASSTATAFSIDKATPTATLEVSNTPTTYDGAAHAATVSITASSTTGAVTNILTGGAATQTAAGTYAVTADFVPTDTANYNTLTEQSAGSFVIDNQSPSSTGATLTALEDTQTALAAGNFGYSDPNSSAFTAVKITSLPALGTLKVSGTSVTNNEIITMADINSGNLTYQSALNGNDAPYTTFGIKVQNATAHWSAAAAMTVNVTAVNDAPVATAQSVNVVINTAKAITLTGTDVEGSALTYTIVTQPTHGALTGTAPSVTYTPTTGYSGADSFTFKVNDGTIDSATAATVSITVGAFSRLSTVSVPSSSMSTNFSAAVILPTSYATSPGRQYSVIYFLDGYNTGGRDGIRIFYDWYQSSLMSLSDKYDVIMVAVGCANKWYLDSPVDSTVKWQTFLTNELIPYVDSNYRSVATRQGRAITGLSMGGFGAFYTAFRNTDKFIAAGSTSGGVDFRPWPTYWELPAVLGPWASNQSVWDANVVINNLGALPPAGGMGIIFDCATNDGFFSGVNAALDTQMTTSSIPHTYNTSTDGGGGHTMGYWGTTFPKHVAFFSQYLTNLTGGSFVMRINTVKTFAAADFRFADAGNSLSAIKVTSLPAHGTLTLSGTPITTVPSDIILASSLETLTYTPTTGYTGADAFDFQLRDTTTFSPDAVMVVSVTTDIPVLNGSFETPIVSGWSVVGSPWTSGAGGYGEYPSVPGFYDAVPTFAGSIAAVIGTGVTTSAPLVQNLGVSVAAGDTLSVTFWVGKAKDGVNSTGASYFEVAGTKYPTAFDTSDLSQGGWKSITMTQKISNSGNLSLGFYWTSGLNTSVDLISNVSVTPEPKGTIFSFLSE